jgi:hypothetical protein
MGVLRFVARLARVLDGGRLVPVSVALGAVLSVGAGYSVAEAVPPPLPSDVMPLSEVKVGMKGHGLSVLSGTEPERFDVEVLAKLKAFRPGQDLVLVKTIHPRLEVVRVVGGMSGSPIYLNGKMIGAYAYGWTFGTEAIAGVTPIESMLADLARPIPKGLLPGAPPLPGKATASPAPTESTGRYRGGLLEYDVGKHAAELAARLPAPVPYEGATLVRATTPIMMGGASAQAIELARTWLTPLGLEPVQAGGGSGKPEAGAPDRYVDGGAIGVQLLRGDVAATGIGTVTRVSGDKVLAFGHPMLGGGLEALPTALARIHWVFSSFNRSFKIGEAIRPLGALVNDRPSAIVIDTSVTAPTYPYHVAFEGVPGAPRSDWNVEVASDRFLSPAFTAIAFASAFEATSSEREEMTWRARHELRIGRFGTIVLEDFGAGNGGPPTTDDLSRSRLVRAMGALLNNWWEPVTIESIRSQVRVTNRREVLRLRGATVLDPEPDAGEPARIRVTLEPFFGKVETRVLEVPIPRELAGKEVEITLSAGWETDRALPDPSSLAELVANLPQQTYDPESLVATIRLRDEGSAAYRGKVVARLPPFALDALRASSGTDVPETFTTELVTALPVGRFVVGRDTVRVTPKPVLR